MSYKENLLGEINKMVINIQANYPELYKFLDEDPITIPNEEHPEMDYHVLIDYLESLHSQLDQYIQYSSKE